MEKRHQRFVIKFFWLRVYRPRQIYQELLTTLGDWRLLWGFGMILVARFQIEDISCGDISWPGRPVMDLAEPFRLFLQDYSFVSARMFSWHFSICATTAKGILVRDIGLKKFTRRCKGGRPAGGLPLQNMSPFRDLWSQILIWDRPNGSALSVVTSSWWTFFGPQFFVQKYLMRNLPSSFSTYRWYCNLWTWWIQNHL
jgi:hypothetical protein